jgi:hypothetical protein
LLTTFPDIHGLLNFVGQPVEMLAQSVEHRAFGLVGGEIADQRGLGGTLSKFFDGRPKFFHDDSGGFFSGDASHAFMCDAVSVCRAFRKAASRAAPGGSDLASSRNRFASASSRSSSDRDCLKRRRCVVMRVSLSG